MYDPLIINHRTYCVPFLDVGLSLRPAKSSSCFAVSTKTASYNHQNSIIHQLERLTKSTCPAAACNPRSVLRRLIVAKRPANAMSTGFKTHF